MNDSLEILGIVLAVIVAFGVLALYIASIVWSYGDAEARGKSGCLVAILVAFLSWPFGLVAWVVFRPDTRKADEDGRSSVLIER